MPRRVAGTLMIGAALAGAPAVTIPATTPAPPVTRLDGSRVSPASIEATVTRLMKGARVPGLGLAILNDGRVVFLKGFGHRDVEKREPLTADTVICGASFTKAAFAYMVMQLVDEGVLDLDRPVERYLDRPLPEYDRYRDLAGDDRWRRLTGRMLLSHTSGFPNWRRFNDDGRLDFKFDPGARYAYSGEGIDLLQLVVETVTGRSVGDLMRERVFARFGMTRTSLVWQPAIAADAAIGYDEDGRPVGHERRRKPDAAGSMDTTVRDFARFLEGVLGGEGLSRKARDQMLETQVVIHSKRQFPTTSPETTDENDAIRLSYGLGWGLLFSPHGKAFFKEGHDDGWENYAIAFDGPKTAIIIMTNSANGESIFKELLATLIGDTFTPWRWENYVPYDQPAAR